MQCASMAVMSNQLTSNADPLGLVSRYRDTFAGCLPLQPLHPASKPQLVHRLVAYFKHILSMDFNVENVGLSVPYLQCGLGFFTHDSKQVPTVTLKTPTFSVKPGDSHPLVHQRLLSPLSPRAHSMLRSYVPSVFKKASQYPKTREKLFHNFVKIFLLLLEIGYPLSLYIPALLL